MNGAGKGSVELKAGGVEIKKGGGGGGWWENHSFHLPPPSSFSQPSSFPLRLALTRPSPLRAIERKHNAVSRSGLECGPLDPESRTPTVRQPPLSFNGCEKFTVKKTFKIIHLLLSLGLLSLYQILYVQLHFKDFLNADVTVTHLSSFYLWFA